MTSLLLAFNAHLANNFTRPLLKRAFYIWQKTLKHKKAKLQVRHLTLNKANKNRTSAAHQLTLHHSGCRTYSMAMQSSVIRKQWVKRELGNTEGLGS